MPTDPSSFSSRDLAEPPWPSQVPGAGRAAPTLHGRPPRTRHQPPNVPSQQPKALRTSPRPSGRSEGRSPAVPSAAGQGVSKALLFAAGLLADAGQPWGTQAPAGRSQSQGGTAQPHPPDASLSGRLPQAACTGCSRGQSCHCSHMAERQAPRNHPPRAQGHTGGSRSVLFPPQGLPRRVSLPRPNCGPLHLSLGGVQHHDDDVGCACHGDHLPATALPWSGGRSVVTQ